MYLIIGRTSKYSIQAVKFALEVSMAFEVDGVSL